MGHARTSAHRWLLVGFMLVALLAISCSAEDGRNSTCTAGSARCRDGGGGANDGGSREGGDGAIDASQPDPRAIVEITLSPMDPVLQVTSADPNPTVTFTAIGRQRDGITRVLNGTVRFTLDVSALGTIDPSSGMFRAAGVGGRATVRAEAMDGSGLVATTSVTVNVNRVVLGPGVTMADVDRFRGAMLASDEATTRPVIDYPLQGAVMPRNVYPPNVMWTPRHAASPMDLYRVRLSRPNATVEGYFLGSAGFRHNWQIPVADFGPIASSNLEGREPIRLTVTVLSGGVIRQSEERQFYTVDAVIAGAVYYWSPPRGRILRIDVDQGRRVDFMPRPESNCAACHSLSRDGRRLAALSTTVPLTVYDLTRDLSGSPPPNVWRNGSQTMRVSSWNPDGTRLVTAPHGCGAMNILNATNGMVLPGSPGTGCDPEWAPSRNEIVWTDGRGNIMVTPMMGETPGTPMMLRAGGSIPGSGNIYWHPRYSPDSNWLVFQSSTATYTRQPASLYIVSRNDPNRWARLDNLNGSMRTNNWRPVFSPFNSGGYFWVLFTSNRPYGNAMAGIRNQKLIWIAAIRNRPEMASGPEHPGGLIDPSEVPYFLEGQEAVTNLDPLWAPPPCRPNGDRCTTGADCCSGECAPDEEGNPMCRPPRMGCRPRGASCSVNADCCAGLVCTMGRICDLPAPG